MRGLTGKTDVLRTELDTATDLLGQAAKLDNADAAVWAEWALVDCRYVDEDYDTSTARLDAARRHAAQATALDPKAPQVRFVQARVMLLLAGNKEKESLEILREGTNDLKARIRIYGGERVYDTVGLAADMKDMVLEYKKERKG